MRETVWVVIATVAAVTGGVRGATADTNPVASGRLTVDEARALVAGQAAKPSASLPLIEAGAVLESLGVPREAVERLLAEARALEPLGGADEVMLLEFLHRTKSAEWLAIRGRFREFLDVPAPEPPCGEAVVVLLAQGDQVTLSGLRSLDAEVADAIARVTGGSLSLPNVAQLSPEVAATLARSGAWFDLRGLATLPPAVATALAAHRGRGLSFGGIVELPVETAEILATHQGHMSLRNLAAMSDAAAAALARKADGDLYLTGLRELRSPELAARLARQSEVGVQLVETLSPGVIAALIGGGDDGQVPRSVLVAGRAVLDPAVAEQLATYRGQQVVLCGDFELDAATARRLAAFQGQRLCFRGLRRLKAEAARELAAFPRELRFPRLVELTRAAAEALAAHKGPLDLSGLTDFPPDVIAAVVQHQARLDLKGITTLTPDVARALAARKGDLVLPGLKTFDAEVAAALATHDGPALVLAGPTTLPSDVAEALAAYRGQHLDLPSLKTLDSIPLAARLAARGRCLVPKLETFPPTVALELAKRNADLALPGVTSPTVEVAMALATHKTGVLNLPGIREVPEDVAVALAAHQGKVLELSGLVRLESLALARRFASQEKCNLRSLGEITPTAALELARRRLDLVLPGVRVLSPEVAAALATHHGALSLPGLEVLDVDVAAALSSHRGGGLGLHGLRAIDRSAASALASHEDPIDLAGLMVTERLDAPEVARLLVKGSRNIALPNMKRFDFPESRTVAEVLATTPGRLSLPSLKAVSPATLLALVRKEDIEIPEIETLELITEPDGSPTDDFVDPRSPEQLRRRRFRGIE